ncbi:polyamine aminopropyltransferase [Streptantibioticus parmotrematis]|uniref:polyamine aminopropyltransferase n=1 Tax=Streptantibioticus parmotrematis TaxID=2873249 RepID=UPI0027E0A21A|nr:polyamine aminopropyltransferase [Streptantibioticus parmotrematis]
MIDQRPTTAVRLPVPAVFGRALVLGSVFLCAACGLVYELELVALGSYVSGDPVTDASVVLSVMVFAMGVGSLLAKRLRCRAVVGFAAVESALALTGGLSSMALYATFAWLGQSWPALAAFAFTIGLLTGAEVPLLMTLIQRIRGQDAAGAVAEVFAADYVGALVGGLVFPFVLLPFLGQLTGVLLTGAVNAGAGGAMAWGLFRGDLSGRARRALLSVTAGVLAALAVAAVCATPFQRAAQRAVYGGSARPAPGGEGQRVVLTGSHGGRGLRLFVDGRLTVSGGDEYRDHQALVHPAMAGPRRAVLILGGGDGLALREVLRYRDTLLVTVVEPDAALVRAARTDPGLRALDRDAFADPRVHVVTADPFDWLRAYRAGGYPPYDVVIEDLPAPGAALSAERGYAEEFYGLAAGALAPGGRLAVDAGSPANARRFWTLDATVRAAGLRTADYWIGGRWGYVLAARTPVTPRLAPDAPPLRSLTAAGLRSAVAAARRSAMRGLPPSTLMRPRYP